MKTANFKVIGTKELNKIVGGKTIIVEMENGDRMYCDSRTGQCVRM